MDKALITGGAGFIGSNLAEYLLKNNWKVTIYDNLSRKSVEKNLDWIKRTCNTRNLQIVIDDVKNYVALKKQLVNVDVVYHLAGQVAVTNSYIDPRKDFEDNAIGGFNVLEAARSMVNKPIVIYSSTNKVYGNMENIKVRRDKYRYEYKYQYRGVREDTPLDFHSPYACSKGAADQYFRDYYRMYGLPTVVFRQSCIYGPSQMGNEDQGWVSHFVISAVQNKKIRIYGDGRQVRDLLHVSDLINAYQKAIVRIDKAKGEIFNIGGGIKNSLSVMELINYLEKITKRKVKHSFAEWRKGDQKIYISDNKKISNALMWKPSIDYKKGISDLYYWVKENEELFC